MTNQEQDEAAYKYIKEHCPRLLRITRNPYTDPARTKFSKCQPNETRDREYYDLNDREYDPSGRAPRIR